MDDMIDMGDRQKPNVQRELVQVSRTTAWVPDGRVMRTEAWRLRMYRYAIPRLGKKGMTLALTLNRDPLNQYQPSGWALFWRTAAFTMLRLLAFDRNLFLIDVRLLFLKIWIFFFFKHRYFLNIKLLKRSWLKMVQIVILDDLEVGIRGYVGFRGRGGARGSLKIPWA